MGKTEGLGFRISSTPDGKQVNPADIVRFLEENGWRPCVEGKTAEVVQILGYTESEKVEGITALMRDKIGREFPGAKLEIMSC